MIELPPDLFAHPRNDRVSSYLLDAIEEMIFDVF